MTTTVRPDQAGPSGPDGPAGSPADPERARINRPVFFSAADRHPAGDPLVRHRPRERRAGARRRWSPGSRSGSAGTTSRSPPSSWSSWSTSAVSRYGRTRLGPRALPPGVQHRGLGVDAVRRRHRHRPDVLRRARAGGAVPHPAQRRGRDGRRGARGHRVDAVPLRHQRLGHVRPDGHGAGLLRLPDEPAAGDPLRAVPAVRAPGGGTDRARGRRRGGARHRLRRGHLAGHRRGRAQRRAQRALRHPDRHRHPDRAQRAGGRDRHDLRGQRRGQGHQAALPAQRDPRDRPGAVDPAHRAHVVPAQRGGAQRRRLRPAVPRHDDADLRLRGHRQLDELLDAVLLGLVDRLGVLRGPVPGTDLARSHDPSVRRRDDDHPVHLHRHVDLDLRQRRPRPGPVGQRRLRRDRQRQPGGRLLRAARRAPRFLGGRLAGHLRRAAVLRHLGRLRRAGDGEPVLPAALGELRRRLAGCGSSGRW